jgi:hypothetical protein
VNLSATELAVATIGDMAGRLMRAAVQHAGSIVQLAAEWEKRAEGGAEPQATNEVVETLQRHMRDIEGLSVLLRASTRIGEALVDAAVEQTKNISDEVGQHEK